MSRHIHIYLPAKVRDAGGPKHAPAGSPQGGQFVSSGGSSGKFDPTGKTDQEIQAHLEKTNTKQTLKSDPKGSGSGKVTEHPQYTKADYDYLKGKGWSDPEIMNRWDEEHAKGHHAQQGNKNAKSGEPGYVKATN